MFANDDTLIMNLPPISPLRKFPVSLTAAVTLALAGCNQYTTPVVESSATTPGAAAHVQQDGASERSANPLNSEASPGETTGSIGGTPGGTSSAQTVPSSSDGIR